MAGYRSWRRVTAQVLSWTLYAQGLSAATPMPPLSAPASPTQPALPAAQGPPPVAPAEEPAEGPRFDANGDEKPPTLAGDTTAGCTSPVRPILECVRNNGGGSYTAFFGYKNENTVAVTIPVGTKNKFTPNPQNRGQPTTFQPGHTPPYPNAAFSVNFNGSNLVWYLKGPDGAGRTVTASAGCAACPAADTTAPQLTWVAPPAVTSDTTPALRVTYVDPSTPPPSSGINAGTFKLFVDGVVRSYMTAGATEAAGTVPDASPLSDGVHQARAEVKDQAGNLGSAVRDFRVDRTAPVIQIVAPGNGATVPTATPQVRITYADSVGVNTTTLQVTVDGVDRTSLFTRGPTEAIGTLTPPLTDGPHPLTASIQDTAGNPASTATAFRVDTAAPQVVIVSPAAGEYTSGTSILVTGGVVDASSVTVTVNGVAAAVDAQGGFAATVPVGSGPTEAILVRATDAAGNVGQASVTVGVDRTNPAISITGPAEGAYVRGPVAVSGVVSDEGPVQVTVNGETATVTGTSYTAQITAPDGPLTLTALARDRANNTASATRSVVVDASPPVITVAAPPAGLVTSAATLQVAGQVQDASPGTISLGGQSAAFPAGGGGFTFDMSPPSDGPVTFALSATDVPGNTGTTTVTVTIDRTAPQLQVVSPVQGAVVGAQPVVVQGTVQDATPVTVTVDGIAASVTGVSWQASFEGLPEGAHTFAVVATDQAGNRTTLDRDVVVDLGPPVVSITAPADGSLTREAGVTVTGTVTEPTIPTVAVNGVTALVQPAASGAWSFTATGVPLAEGDNTLRAVATDVGGRTGEASVLVTRDSTPPVVALATPESISRNRPGQATASVTDAVGVGQVTVSVNGQVAGTFTSPPYQVPLTVPPGVNPTDTLTVVAQATDLAGNVGQASRGVRVVGEGVVVGQVLSDLTGLPLAGALVEALGGQGQEPDVTDEHGKYSLPARDTTMLLVARKGGFVSVERLVTVAANGGTVPVDARLTPLAPATLVGSGGGAAHVRVPPAPPPVPNAPELGVIVPRPFSVTVTLPPGAVSGDTPVHVTPLTPQGLPGLLPLGWAPAAAFDVRAGTGTFTCAGGCPAGIAFPPPLPAGPVHLAAYSAGLHAWILVAADVAATDGAFGIILPAVGAYALVSADLAEPPLALPSPGEVLAGLPMVALANSAQSAGAVDPAILPPTGGTARGTISVTSPVAVPSGTVLQAEVKETFTLASGEVASEETRLQDILIYRSPLPVNATPPEPVPSAPPLYGVLPLTPARTFQATELVEGRVHLDILAGREGVRGTTGGSSAVTVEAGTSRLAIPAGALPEDTAISLSEEPFSEWLPSLGGLVALQELFVDFSGQLLGLPAELSIDGSALTPGDTFVLAQVERIDGIPKLQVVALAALVSDRLVSNAYPGLAGVRREGRYVFFRLPGPVGFVSGFTTSGGTPVPALVKTDGLPFVGLAAPDGRYIVAGSPGTVALAAVVPRTSLAATATATVMPLETATVDIVLGGTVTTATVTPADGSVSVDPNVQVQIESAVPLNPATAITGNVRLYRLPSGPGDPVPVTVRLVLAGSGRRLSVVPEARLEFSTRYRLDAAGLADAVGGLITVPAVLFTTRSDAPPVYDVDALTFSFPNTDGNVTLYAPPGTFPPGTEILIINAGNGVVLSLVAENDGAVGVLVPALLPATLDDRLMITITDPFGNTTTFERSQYVDPATGQTAVGSAGGVVTGSGGVELRIPDGALDRGITFKIEGLSAAQLEALFPGQRPVLPGAQLSSGLKIESAQKPAFRKEVDLAFPLPDFQACRDSGDCTAPPEGQETDAFYYVYRRIEGPCPNGAPTCPAGQRRILYQTLDQAFIEGPPAARKVVTASDPFSGYIDSLGSLAFSPTAGMAVAPVLASYAILMWTFDQAQPAKPLPGVITGMVRRVTQTPEGPVFTPIEGAAVSGVGPQGIPLLVAGSDPTVAFTNAQGKFTMWDSQYEGGTVRVSAALPGYRPGPCPDPPTDDPATTLRCGTAEQANPQTYGSPSLAFYRNLATVNLTFPAENAPPPARVDIDVLRQDGAAWLDTGGLVVAGTPLRIGFSADEDTTVTSAVLQGQERGVRNAAEAGLPPGIRWLLDPDFTPSQPGNYTITARALSPFGPPISESRTFRVLAEGGTNNDPNPGEPPAVVSVFPDPDATGVAVNAYPRVIFSEPVKQVPGNVALLEVKPDGTEVAVPVRLSGVGPQGPIDPITSASEVITSLTVQPLSGLKYATRHVLRLSASASSIVDLDPVDVGGPRPLAVFETAFKTYGPDELESQITDIRSPNLAVLGNRAYFVQNYFTWGSVRVFDVGNPVSPEEIPQDPLGYVTNRPVDLVGQAEESAVSEGKLILVATSTTNRSVPSNVFLFDTTEDTATRWIGAASLTNSVLDGYVTRIAVQSPFAFAATSRKGIQVMDLRRARDLFAPPGTADHFRMRQALNSDGQGWAQEAVTQTIPVPAPNPGNPSLPPDPKWVYLTDVKVGDYLVDGVSTTIAVATGNVPLAVAKAHEGQLLPRIPVRKTQQQGGQPVVSELLRGDALALGQAAGSRVAVLVGAGSIGGTARSVLAVVSLNDPANPQVLSVVEIEGATGSPVDVLLRDGTALVGTTNEVVIMSIGDPEAPRQVGIIQGLAGKLAMSAGQLYSTARNVLGGDMGAANGLHVVNLAPDGCPLLDLVTPRVTVERLRDTLNGRVCGQAGEVVFTACRAAKVTLSGPGLLAGVLDDSQFVGPVTEMAVAAGVHRIYIPPDANRTLTEQTPFVLKVQALLDGEQQQAPGVIHLEVKDKAVLPVGRTFVKGVDLYDGHLAKQAVDFEMRGRHLGLEVSRTYSSAGISRDDVMGAGWSFQYSSELTIDNVCPVAVVGAVNGTQVFQQDQTGAYVPQKGYHTRLRANSDGTYDFFDKANHRHRFASPRQGRYRLEYIEEPHGDRLKVDYDSKNRVIGVTELQGPQQSASGHYLQVTYVRKGGFDRVRKVVGVGAQVEYTYDDLGNLKEVRRVEGAGTNPTVLRKESYEYAPPTSADPYQMTAAIEPNGRGRTVYRYYSANDTVPGYLEPQELVKEVEEVAGPDKRHVTKLSYDGTARSQGELKTTVRDPRDNPTLYVLNGNGSPTRIEEPLGRTTRMTWHPTDILKMGEEDALGRQTTYEYDGSGNLTAEKIQTADLGLVETRYEYDPTFNKLTFKRDAEGRETTYGITDKGDVEFQRDAEGNRTDYTYDASGRLTEVKDPRRNTTAHSQFDFFGEAGLVSDPYGLGTIRRRTNHGLLEYEQDPHTGRILELKYDLLDREVERKESSLAPNMAPEVTKTEYYPGGQPRKVTNPLLGVTEFDIDGLGRPVETTHRVGGSAGAVYTSTAEHDGNGNKVLETDRRGVQRRYTYDALNRLRQVEILSGPAPEGPLGVIQTFDYDLVGNRTRETDIAGNVTEYVHDGLYRVKVKKLPETNPTTIEAYQEEFVFDKVGNLRVARDANGKETARVYDGLNRVTLQTDAVGRQMRYTYADPEGSKVNLTLEENVTSGLRTERTFDRVNRETLRRVVLAGPGGDNAVYPTATQYVAYGYDYRVVTDPRNVPITQVYDAKGRQVMDRRANDTVAWQRRYLNLTQESEDEEGHKTVSFFDGLGRQFMVRDAEGVTSLAGYDGEGLKTSETDRRGVRREFRYDNLGRLVETSLDVAPFSGVPWSQNIEYQDGLRRRIEKDARSKSTMSQMDRMGRVVTVTDANGKTMETSWDGVNKRSEKDRRGNTTLFEYDGVNRLIKSTDPAPFNTQSVETTYADTANTVTVKDRRGKRTVTQLDPLGRTRTVTREGVLQESNGYDGNGNKVLASDGEGRKTQFVYDESNRLKQRTDGFESPAASITTLVLFKDGLVKEEKDQRLPNNPVRRTYFRTHLLKTETNGDLETTTYAYDQEGNRTSVDDPITPPTTFDYDELGKLMKVTQPGGRVTRYTYDPNRNRVRQTDANTHDVQMAYDDLNRLTTMVQDPGGLDLTTVHGYDDNGNETSLQDPKQQTVTSTYDELNRLKSKAYAFASGDTYRPWRHTTGMAYDYDPNGNLTQADESVASGTDPPAVLRTSRSYDDLDRLQSETSPLPDGGTRSVFYTYFANGTRKTVTSSTDNQATTYAYDGQNRLESATTAAGATTYAYWPDDLLKTVTYPNGVTATHEYDPADRLASLTNAKGGVPVSSYTYTHDDNGNRISQTEANGGLTEVTGYGYDELNRLETIEYPADATYPDGRIVTYGYDAVGNRTSELTTNPATAATLASKTGLFDSVNRLTRLTDNVDAAQTVLFGYDPNGNQVSKSVGPTATTYRFDVRDRMVEAAQGASILGRFQYDFQGRRNKKIGEEGVRQYVYDQTSLFVELDETGAQKARYDYGSDRLISLTRADEGRRFYSLDGLRSVVNLTDDSGAAVASYHLDPWGNFRFPAELSASKNRVSFTGYVWDPELHLFNAKARFYDPAVGRFTSQDSFLGSIDDPPSLHRYFYANANPSRYIDPTGHANRPSQITGHTRDNVYYDDTTDTTYVGTGVLTATEEVDVVAYPDRASAVGASLDVNLTQPANRIGTRGLGAARAAGGVVQVTVGSAAVAAPEPTMLSKVGGGVLIAHGVDDIQAGIRQATTGVATETLTGVAIRKTAEKAGADPQTAALISAGGETLLTAGAGLAARVPAPLTTLGRITPEAPATVPITDPGRLLAAPTTTPLPQDLAINPAAPNALPLARRIGSSRGQHAELQADVAAAQAQGAKNIRINQQQLDAAGNRVGTNRPDLSYTRPDGTRAHVEYDTARSGRGIPHADRLLANDPKSVVETKTIN
jgi:RHS repeat-associated protein